MTLSSTISLIVAFIALIASVFSAFWTSKVSKEIKHSEHEHSKLMIKVDILQKALPKIFEISRMPIEADGTVPKDPAGFAERHDQIEMLYQAVKPIIHDDYLKECNKYMDALVEMEEIFKSEIKFEEEDIHKYMKFAQEHLRLSRRMGISLQDAIQHQLADMLSTKRQSN